MWTHVPNLHRPFLLWKCQEDSRQVLWQSRKRWIKCFAKSVLSVVGQVWVRVHKEWNIKHLLFLFKHVQMEGRADPFKKIQDLGLPRWRSIVKTGNLLAKRLNNHPYVGWSLSLHTSLMRFNFALGWPFCIFLPVFVCFKAADARVHSCRE